MPTKPTQTARFITDFCQFPGTREYTAPEFKGGANETCIEFDVGELQKALLFDPMEVAQLIDEKVEQLTANQSQRSLTEPAIDTDFVVIDGSTEQYEQQKAKLLSLKEQLFKHWKDSFQVYLFAPQNHSDRSNVWLANNITDTCITALEVKKALSNKEDAELIAHLNKLETVQTSINPKDAEFVPAITVDEEAEPTLYNRKPKKFFSKKLSAKVDTEISEQRVKIFEFVSAIAAIYRVFLGKRVPAAVHTLYDEQGNIQGSASQAIDIKNFISYASLFEKEIPDIDFFIKHDLARIVLISVLLGEDDLHNNNHGPGWRIDFDFCELLVELGLKDQRPYRIGTVNYMPSANDFVSFPVLKDFNPWYNARSQVSSTNFIEAISGLFGNNASFPKDKLQKDEAFTKQKWTSALRALLVPASIWETIATKYLSDAPIPSLVKQGHVDTSGKQFFIDYFVEHFAKIEQTLLGIPDFHQFIVSMSAQEQNELIDDAVTCFTTDSPELGLAQALVKKQLQNKLAQVQTCCYSKEIIEILVLPLSSTISSLVKHLEAASPPTLQTHTGLGKIYLLQSFKHQNSLLIEKLKSLYRLFLGLHSVYDDPEQRLAQAHLLKLTLAKLPARVKTSQPMMMLEQVLHNLLPEDADKDQKQEGYSNKQAVEHVSPAQLKKDAQAAFASFKPSPERLQAAIAIKTQQLYKNLVDASLPDAPLDLLCKNLIESLTKYTTYGYKDGLGWAVGTVFAQASGYNPFGGRKKLPLVETTINTLSDSSISKQKKCEQIVQFYKAITTADPECTTSSSWYFTQAILNTLCPPLTNAFERLPHQHPNQVDIILTQFSVQRAKEDVTIGSYQRAVCHPKEILEELTRTPANTTHKPNMVVG